MSPQNVTVISRIRRVVAGIPGVRSTWYLGCTLRDVWRDSAEFSEIELRQEFSRSDPWRYTTNDLERLRHQGELSMLDCIPGAGRFVSALELGCAEGIFTEHLAKRCESLLSADFNRVALERAKKRLCHEQHVNFFSLDLRSEPIPGQFDLICAMHVLEYIQSPFPLSKIREKIVNAIKPGGHLLLGCVSFDSPQDKSWWSKYLLRGGRAITNYFAAHPKLTTVASAIHPLEECDSIDLLFRRDQ